MNTKKTFELAGVFTNVLSTQKTKDLETASPNWAEIENAGQKNAELYTGV